MYNKVRSARPKIKKDKLNIIAISPKTKRALPARLGFVCTQAKFIFKLPFPNIDVDLTIIEENSVSCGPYHPTGSDHYFDEDATTKSCSCFYQRIQ